MEALYIKQLNSKNFRPILFLKFISNFDPFMLNYSTVLIIIPSLQVSSDSEAEAFMAKVKHPYDVRPAGPPPITFNIAVSRVID